MACIETGGDLRIDRRTFLLANLALATGVSAKTGRSRPSPNGCLRRRRAREDALPPCIDRIRSPRR